jgi:hypothetical protein
MVQKRSVNKLQTNIMDSLNKKTLFLFSCFLFPIDLVQYMSSVYKLCNNADFANHAEWTMMLTSKD